MQVPDRAAALNAAHCVACLVREAANRPRLHLQGAEHGAVGLLQRGRALAQVKGDHLSVSKASHQKRGLHVHGEDALRELNRVHGLGLLWAPEAQSLVPAGRDDQILLVESCDVPDGSVVGAQLHVRLRLQVTDHHLVVAAPADEVRPILAPEAAQDRGLPGEHAPPHDLLVFHLALVFVETTGEVPKVMNPIQELY